MVKALVRDVLEGSIADDLGLSDGDVVFKINNETVGDIIDYLISTSDNYIELTVEKKDGEVIIFEIEKNHNEDLGIEFDPPTITSLKTCQNNCQFCFINQMPPGLRDTLYLKDDDYRMSFIMGNYITGTNLNNEEIERIIKYNLSPLYISVHQTGKGRDFLMGRTKSFSILELLNRLKDGGINFHTQIVLVPGINDGKELKNTLKDLLRLKPNILSIAIVPVGLTKFRKNLPFLKTVSNTIARQTIDIAESFRRNDKDNIVFVSDELWIRADYPIPEAKYYQDYSQLENGIGMLRLFSDEFSQSLEKYRKIIKEKKFTKKCLVITGELTEQYINNHMKKIKQINNTFNYDIVSIENKFFGKTVNVTGLLVGQDIINVLSNYSGDNLYALLPESTLNYDKEKFLDNITLIKLKSSLYIPIKEVEVRGECFIKEILKEGVN